MPTVRMILIALGGGLLLLIEFATSFSGNGSLDRIKSKTVGDGQHRTARWATVKQIYAYVPFRPTEWRKGTDLPKV